MTNTTNSNNSSNNISPRRLIINNNSCYLDLSGSTSDSVREIVSDDFIIVDRSNQNVVTDQRKVKRGKMGKSYCLHELIQLIKRMNIVAPTVSEVDEFAQSQMITVLSNSNIIKNVNLSLLSITDLVFYYSWHMVLQSPGIKSQTKKFLCNKLLEHTIR